MNSDLLMLARSGAVKAPQVILLALLTPDCSGLLVSELADATGYKMSLVSTTVSSLIDETKAEKRYPYRDSRTVRVYLTPKGREEASGFRDAIFAYCEGQNRAVAAQMQET
jgi:hypothetical protein